MKHLTLALIAATTLVGTAHASYFKTECSSADRTTFLAGGHIEDRLLVTRRDHAAEPPESVVSLDRHEVKVEEIGRVVHVSEKDGRCFPDGHGGGSGWSSVRTIYFTTLRLTKVDGSAFDPKIVGVSVDGLSIDAPVLCEHYVDGETSCNPGTK